MSTLPSPPLLPLILALSLILAEAAIYGPPKGEEKEKEGNKEGGKGGENTKFLFRPGAKGGGGGEKASFPYFARNFTVWLLPQRFLSKILN